MAEQEKNKVSNSKEPINLRRIYPIAYRSILRRSFVWIVGLIILMIIIPIVDSFTPGNGTMVDQVFFFLETTILILGIIVVCTKIIYEFIYFRLYYYGIELEHLIISRGLFFKTRTSIPLASLSDIYIDREPIDLLFSLYNLRFTTASPAEHGPVEGLSHKNAFDFQNYLLALANTTVKPVDNEAAKEILSSSKVTKEPGLFDKCPANVDPPSSAPENLPEQHRSTTTENTEAKKVLSPSPVPAPTSENIAMKIEKVPLKEEIAPTPSLVANKILDELQHTQEELKKTRDELTHAEEVLEKTRDKIEHQTK